MINITDLVEITLKEKDDFLKVRETLTRIGVASKKDKTLFQSCHILHKKGHYYLVHFKELFALDGKQSDFTTEDKGRRNTIIQLLSEWGLIKVVDQETVKEPKAPMSQVKIIPHKDKANWTLEAKYNIGRKKK